MSSDYDLCIIGGGVNGAGIAREAVTRGMKVILAEAGDLAGATSSASTKLIHGGLRYLEYYEFKLVHEALAERQILLGIAPHIIKPLIFVLPHDKSLRPAWMIRMGLFLYDHLASHGKLPGSHGIKFSRNRTYGSPLKDSYKQGFTYSDCWVDDARLVALNAMDSKERGADILTRTRCTRIAPEGERWAVTLEGDNTAQTIRAKMIVNATGPWVRHLLDQNGLTRENTPSVRLVKGSHIVTMKLFEGDQAYILQQPDRRIIFAIPYEKDFTLIGTTDEEFHDDPPMHSGGVKISQKEIDYLCDAINRSFKKQIRPTDVVWSYAGVRPLFDDGRNNASSVTRDYHLTLDDFNGLPLLSVFGGKITTYRHLAAEAVLKLCHFINHRDAVKGGVPSSVTGKTPLPGGDIPDGDFAAFLVRQNKLYPWLPAHLLERYARAYGTRMDTMLGTAQHLGDLGQHFGGHLYEAEIRYLIDHEFACTAEDIFWRRTKLGLHCNPETVIAVEQALPGLLKR